MGKCPDMDERVWRPRCWTRGQGALPFPQVEVLALLEEEWEGEDTVSKGTVVCLCQGLAVSVSPSCCCRGYWPR